MPEIIYLDSDGSEKTIERDDMTHRYAFVVVFDNPDDEAGVRDKMSIPVERIVEIDH